VKLRLAKVANSPTVRAPLISSGQADLPPHVGRQLCLRMPDVPELAPFEARTRLILLHVRPSLPASPAATTASADFSLRPVGVALFPRSVALPQLRFASFTMACLREDLNLLVDAHAWAHKNKGLRRCAVTPYECW
jgi:hypothetical protein